MHALNNTRINMFLLVCMYSVMGFAAPMAPVPIPSLVATADHAVIGYINSEANTGARTHITIEIETVLKGNLTNGQVVNAVITTSTERPPRPFPSTIRVLVFLRNTATGVTHEVLPVVAGAEEIRDSIFAVPKNGRSTPVPGGASALDRVLASLSDALDSDTPAKPGLGAPISLVSAARQTRSAVLRTALNRYIKSADPKLQQLGIAGLIAMNDPAGIAAAEARGDLDSPIILNEIRWSYSVDDAGSIQALARLVNRKGAVSVAAAAALARVHTSAALPVLASLLDGNDANLQAIAVGGLALFANNVPPGESHPAPGTWKYRTDATMRNSAMDANVIRNNPSILAFWKSWWNEHRSEIESGKP